MKKITRKSLDELAKTMPVLNEKEQRYYLGGTGVGPNGFGTGIDDHIYDGGTFPDVVVSTYGMTKPKNLSANASFSWYHTEHDYFFPAPGISDAMDWGKSKLKDALSKLTEVESKVSYILSKANHPSGEPFGMWTDGSFQVHICDRYGNEIGQIDRWTGKVYAY